MRLNIYRNANDLRRVNNFTGSNLTLAPQKLIIPKTSGSLITGNAPLVRRETNDSIVSSGSARSGRDDDFLVSSLPSLGNLDSSGSDEEQDGEDFSGNGPRYHDVNPTDTMENLCKEYRITAPALRQANMGLTGRNLQAGPKRLLIPRSYQ